MKNLAKASLWLLLTGVMMIAAASCDRQKKANEVIVYSTGGTFGLIDMTGTLIVEPQFDGLDSFSEGLACVEIDGKYGFIDKTGKIVVEPQFDWVGEFSDGLARVELDGKCGFIDKTGKMVIELQFDDADSFSDGLARVELDGKYGFIDKTGKMVVGPRFDWVDDFSEGMSVVTLDGKVGFADKSGRLIIPQFDGAYGFSEGLACVEIDGKYGFIDKTGKMVIEPRFDLASSFSNALASVGLDGKYGIIDRTGKMVIEPQFDDAEVLSNGIVRVVLAGKYGFVDKTGKMVIEPQFDWAEDFSEDMSVVTLDGKVGFADKSGRLIIPQFDEAYSFSEGMASVEIDGKYGFIDKTGKMVIEPQFDWADRFSEGLASVELAGKYGFIDKTGKMIIKPQFDMADYFSDGMAYVAMDDSWAFIDTTGKKLFEFNDNDIACSEYRNFFGNGLCSVYKNVKCGLCNGLGKHITEPLYDYLYEEAGLYYAGLNGKEGIIDKKGEIIANFEYDDIFYFRHGYAVMKIDDKFGVIDLKGNVVVEPEYDEIEFVEEGEPGLAWMVKDGQGDYYDSIWNPIIPEQFGIEHYLIDLEEVVYDNELNSLDPTPKELNELVAETGVDIRNSLYLILYGMSDYNWQQEYNLENEREFIEENILDNMVSDPAIHNLYYKDYNSCVESTDLKRLNKEGNPCWDVVTGWGPTWRSRFVEKILTSKHLQEILYEWVKPTLIHYAYNECLWTQKMCMVNAINHMIVYTANYDHQAEKAFYNACLQTKYGESLFNENHVVDMCPDYSEVGNPYRKLETWVYRRVEEGSMDAGQIHNWLVRIRHDLGMDTFQCY